MKKEESGLELSPQRGDSQHVVPVAALAAQEAETLGSRAKQLLIRTLPLFAVIDNHDLKVVGAAHWLAGAHLVIYIVALLYFLVKGTLTRWVASPWLFRQMSTERRDLRKGAACHLWRLHSRQAWNLEHDEAFDQPPRPFNSP